MYSIRLLTDCQAVFVLTFEGEEIEVARCVKTNSTEWHILSGVVPESVRGGFASPAEALGAYQSYITGLYEDDE